MTKQPTAMQPLDIDVPQPGHMVALADDLYWFRFSLPFRLNHINLYALDTADGWLLIDCGIKADSNAVQWPPMLDGPLAGKPIAGILVTHYHADHVGYAGQLSKLTGAPIMTGAIEHEMMRWALDMTNADYETLAGKIYSEFGLPEDVIERTKTSGNFYRSLVGELPDVTILEAGHEIKTVAGNWQIRFDGGHSPGHMSFSEHARKLYLGIDFLLPRISPNVSAPLRNINADVLADYFTYLHDMCSLDNDWLVISGHDWPYYGGGIRAAALIAHHQQRLAQLMDAAKITPLSTKMASDHLFPFELTDHEVFFASCEARAHLNHLLNKGQMNYALGNDNIGYFSLS